GAEIVLHSGIEHMAGFPFVLPPPSSGYVHRADLSDGAGNFQLPTTAYIAGSWFSISLLGYSRETVFLPSSPPATFDVVLKERAVRPMVSGIVIGATGGPVADATVRLAYAEGQTDEHGQFAFEIPYVLDGKHLLAYSKGFVPSVTEDFSTRLNADPSTGQDLVLRLGDPTRSIQGRVQDANGAPLYDIEIKLRSAMSDGSSSVSVEEHIAENPNRTITSDREGQFTISGLFQDRYDLDAYDRKSYLGASVKGVTPGATDVVITLDPATRIPLLKGRVVDSRGLGVSGATLNATFATHISDGLHSWVFKELGRAEEDGVFELENVPTSAVGFRAGGLHITGVHVDLTGWHARALEGELLEIEVPLELHFQLNPQAVAGATRFRVLDDSRTTLSILARSTSLFKVSSPDYWIKPNVPLPTFVVGASASELVLYNGDAFLRRIFLDLKRGEIIQLN
ncbi:MAG: hypothetical protein ACI9X4_002744, partial [Glaciecola sp.]